MKISMKKLKTLGILSMVGVLTFGIPSYASAAIKNIPDDAVLYNGHYYKLYDEGLVWSDAKNFCAQKNGHLATITSQGEQNIIEGLLKNGTRNSYWIGGLRNDSTNSWEWITGENFSSYTHWSSSMPDNCKYSSSIGENCLMVYRNPNPLSESRLGTWNDLYEGGTCGAEPFFGLTNFGLICEWDEPDKVETDKDETDKSEANKPSNDNHNSVVINPSNEDVDDPNEGNDYAGELSKNDIKVYPAKKTIKVGQTIKIKIVVQDTSEWADLSDEEWEELCQENIDSIKFRSTKSSIASVGKNSGKVKGKKKGTAVIKTTINLANGESVIYKTKVYVTK